MIPKYCEIVNIISTYYASHEENHRQMKNMILKIYRSHVYARLIIPMLSR